METCSKKARPRPRRVSWLNLHTVIPDINVRKMIYAYLTRYDKMVVECAHNSKMRPRFAHFTTGFAFPLQSFSEHCAKRGYLSLLQWGLANGCRLNSRVSCFAACGGQLEVLQWLRYIGCHMDRSACYYAEKRNHAEVSTWLYYNGCVCGGIYH
jgi:hypothetical protein